MSFAYIGSTSFFPASATLTSGAFDTTGATLIVITCSYYNGNPGAPTDNKGNTYTPLTNRGAAYANQQMYYCANPVVGAGHTFTQPSSPASNNVSASVAWFSGTVASGVLDVESGGTTLSASITPSQANSLIVFAAAGWYGPANPCTVSSPFTAAQAVVNGVPDEPACVAYYIQGSAATVTPTWTIGGSPISVVHSIAVFKPGATDTTPPVLTSPTGTATSATTATIGATTDEGNGTLYAVVTTSATQPSVAQIKAGQTHTGAAAPWGGSVVVTSTGAKTLNATGLTASTGYYAHLVHTDAANNNSNRVSSALFTTSALPHFDLTLANRDFSTNNGTAIASTAVTFWAHNPTTGALVATITGLSTNASGVVTAPVAHASLAPSTLYRLNYEFSSGEYGVAKLSTEA